MRKSALICVLFFVISFGMWAYPAPMWRVGNSKSTPLDPSALHIDENDVYILDRKSNQVMVVDSETGTNSRSLLRLGKSAVITDLFVRDRQIYLLDSKRSGVLVVDTSGSYLRDFFTSGNPGLRFKNPKRILVNYQGYIYILDDWGIRGFTMEGVPFVSAPVNSAISMSLGEDQLLRVLRHSSKGQVVEYLDQNLKIVSASMVMIQDRRPANIADLAINQWGEMHVINRDATNIGKLGPNGAILPNTVFGAFDKGSQIGVFQYPTQIKCGANGDTSIIGILDSKQKAIHFFKDSESFTGQLLHRPAYTMRPSLKESTLPACTDYLEFGDITYMISSLSKTRNVKPLASVWAMDAEGKTLFITQIKDLPKKTALSFTALALHQNYLYVLDTKAATVHVLDKHTGKYQSSFAQKGKRANNLMNPVDIAIGDNGLIYIADSGHGRIAIFSEHRMFVDNITMPEPKLKPLMLKVYGDKLYYLSNADSVYELKLNNPQKASLFVNAPGLGAFELVYDGKAALLDKQKQSIKIVGKAGKELELLAFDKKAIFPFFANIHKLRYFPEERKLAILDINASHQRFLMFFAAPDRPDVITMSLNDAMQAVLSWERMPGIQGWQVYQVSDADTIVYNVTEPKFVISEPQSSILNYQICSIAADGKKGELSFPIEDAYSYALYLRQNGNHAAAIYALYRSNQNISDNRIDEQIVANYIEEAKLYQRSGQADKALESLNSAAKVSGPTSEIGILAVDIFRQKGDYRAGIDYLNLLGPQSSPEIMEAYIDLHHRLKDHQALILHARSYNQKFGFNETIMRSEVEAYKATGQYALALSTLNELVNTRPGFEDKLAIADLQIKLGNFSQANSYLQRMLTEHRNEKLDRAYALLGECNFQLGQYGSSSDYFNNAILIDEGIADYYYKLAKTYHELLNNTEALRNFQIAHERDPHNQDFGIGYARALERENRFVDALRVLDSVAPYAQDDQSSADFHLFYSELLTREARYDDAYREILIVQAYFPDDPEVARKVNEAFAARELYNRDKPPVEIKKVTWDPVFPSLHEYYRNNPIGTITLFNNRSVPITDIELKIFIPQIMDSEAKFRIPSLIANENHEHRVVVNLNRRVFEYSRELNPRISITYALEDSLYTVPHSISRLNVLQDTAMNWGNRRQLASFVNPSDTMLRTFISSVLLQSYDAGTPIGLNPAITKALQVYSFYRANSIRYTPDPSAANRDDTQIDYVQYPFQTLNSKGGDCEDLMVLLATSLEVVGVETGFIDIPGHVIPVIDTKMDVDEILNSGISVEFFIHRNGTYWLPLESTMLSTQDFITSWLDARKQYDNVLDSGVYPEIFRFSQIHSQYPPAQNFSAIDSGLYRETTTAKRYFEDDTTRILQMSLISKEQEYTETLRRYPRNLTVKNEYALWSLSKGKNQQAERLWQEMLNQDPENFNALVNLGNYYYGQGIYGPARIHYLNALKHNRLQDDIRRNLCILEYRAGNTPLALEYFRAIANKQILRDADISIYSEFINKGD